MEVTELTMDEARASSLDEEYEQFVTFEVAGEIFGFPMREVREIVRVPETVAVPLTSPSLVGLSNLRGTVLPVLDTREMLGMTAEGDTSSARVVVTDALGLVGLIVDRVDRVVALPPTAIEAADAAETTVGNELLAGVAKHGEDGTELIQLLDLRRLVEGHFTAADAKEASASGAHGARSASGLPGREEAATEAAGVKAVTFHLAGEEYALPVEHVEEVVRVPDVVRSVPGAPAEMLGLIRLRERLLPLMDLRRIVGLPAGERSGRQRIVVACSHGSKGQHVGLVVDEVRSVMTLPDDAIEPMPPLLAEGLQDTSQRIGRLEEGRRLISLLEVGALLNSTAVRGARASMPPDARPTTREENNTVSETEEIQLVVFRLGREEYATPIFVVSEIVHLPERLTAVPGAAAHIVGMMNLRGNVLPVLDLSTRLGLQTPDATEGQRVLVLEREGVRVGYVVDAVTEVLRLPRHRLEPAPQLSSDQARLFAHVANLVEQQRMIQIIETAELFDGAADDVRDAAE